MTNVECDVVVVGGGIAGAGVASELASDRRVVLLEQEEYAGVHATGRSAAIHTETYGNGCIRLLTRASRTFFIEGRDGQSFAARRPCVFVATENQVERLNAFAQSPGVALNVDRIDGAEITRLVPVIRTDMIVAALAERNSYDLDVDAIHTHFLWRFRQQGGTVQCSAGVTALSHEHGAWTVTTPVGVFRAPVVVNAAGAWGDLIGTMAGAVPVGLEARRRTVALVDSPVGVDPQAWPAIVDIDEQFYFKPEAGKILMSPADETLAEPCDAYADDIDVAIAIDRIQRIADIPVTRVTHSWAGLRTFAADRSPVVGFDGVAPGFFWLVGQGGYGIQTSPALSRVAAALIRDEAIPPDLAKLGLDPAELAPQRFSRGA